jgi:hypothetical protein
LTTDGLREHVLLLSALTASISAESVDRREAVTALEGCLTEAVTALEGCLTEAVTALEGCLTEAAPAVSMPVLLVLLLVLVLLLLLMMMLMMLMMLMMMMLMMLVMLMLALALPVAALSCGSGCTGLEAFERRESLSHRGSHPGRVSRGGRT